MVRESGGGFLTESDGVIFSSPGWSVSAIFILFFSIFLTTRWLARMFRRRAFSFEKRRHDALTCSEPIDVPRSLMITHDVSDCGYRTLRRTTKPCQLVSLVTGGLNYTFAPVLVYHPSGRVVIRVVEHVLFTSSFPSLGIPVSST